MTAIFGESSSGRAQERKAKNKIREIKDHIGSKRRINMVENLVKDMMTDFWELNKVKWEWKEMKQILDCSTGNREFNIRTEKYSNI